MPAKNLHRVRDSGVYLHIYNKGFQNLPLFKDKEDTEVFLNFLNDYLSTPKDQNSLKKDFQIKGRTFKGTPHLPKNYHGQVELIDQKLEAGQFDLLLLQKESGAVEKLLRSLCTRYSIYFNKKYQRSGTLFIGPYKSSIVAETDLGKVRQAHFQAESPFKQFEDMPEEVKPSLKVTNQPATDREQTRFRVFEFTFASFVILALLSSFSLRNILTNPKPLSLPSFTFSQNSEVLSASKEVNIVPNPKPVEIGVASPSAEPKQTLIISTGETSAEVNIRKEPNAKSARIGRAKEGQVFEVLSTLSEWFEVKLASGSGYINTAFVQSASSSALERRDVTSEP